MTAPRWHAEHQALSLVASDLSAKRAAHYPAAVEKGVLTAAEASAGLRIMSVIAADWRRVAALAAREAHPERASRRERIETLTTASRRAHAIAAKNLDDIDLAEYAELIDVLLWWERHPVGIQLLADVTIAGRALAGIRSPELAAA